MTRRIPHALISSRELQLFPLHLIMSQFPEVQGGGSLIVAWQVRNKHVLVIGGGGVRLWATTC